MPGDLNADERAELWQLADDGITALTAAMAPHGFNCGMNLGRVAGAGIRRSEGPRPARTRGQPSTQSSGSSRAGRLVKPGDVAK